MHSVSITNALLMWQTCTKPLVPTPCNCMPLVAIDDSCHPHIQPYPDSKVNGANMGPIWGRQDPGGPHGSPMNLAIWVPKVSPAGPLADGSYE